MSIIADDQELLEVRVAELERERDSAIALGNSYLDSLAALKQELRTERAKVARLTKIRLAAEEASRAWESNPSDGEATEEQLLEAYEAMEGLVRALRDTEPGGTS